MFIIVNIIYYVIHLAKLKKDESHNFDSGTIVQLVFHKEWEVMLNGNTNILSLIIIIHVFNALIYLGLFHFTKKHNYPIKGTIDQYDDGFSFIIPHVTHMYRINFCTLTRGSYLIASAYV